MSQEDLARARRTGVAVWVWLAVGGVVSLVLGLVVLVSPGASLRVLAVVLSLWLLATGLGRVGLAAGMRTWTTARRGLQILLGVALAAAGVAGLLGLWDARTVISLVVATGFLVAALGDLLTAATSPRGAGRAATTGLGLLHLVVGLTFLLLPDVGLGLLGVLVGLALLVLGLVQLGASALVRALVRQADAVSARLGGRVVRGDLAGDRDASTHPFRDTSRDPDDGDPRVVRGEIL